MKTPEDFYMLYIVKSSRFKDISRSRQGSLFILHINDLHYTINCCIIKTTMLQTTQGLLILLILMKNEQAWQFLLETIGYLINQKQNLSKHQSK